MTYTGNLYMGSDGAKSEVVFDTGSQWMVNGVSGCANCRQTSYDPMTSGRIVKDEVSEIKVS